MGFHEKFQRQDGSNNRKLFPHSSDSWNSRQRCGQSWFLLKPVFFVCKLPSSCDLFPLRIHVLISSSYKGSSQVRLRPIWMTSFNHRFLLKGPFYKYSLILRTQYSLCGVGPRMLSWLLQVWRTPVRWEENGVLWWRTKMVSVTQRPPGNSMGRAQFLRVFWSWFQLTSEEARKWIYLFLPMGCLIGTLHSLPCRGSCSWEGFRKWSFGPQKCASWLFSCAIQCVLRDEIRLVHRPSLLRCLRSNLCSLCFGIRVISAVCWRLCNNSTFIHFSWNLVFQPNSVELSLMFVKKVRENVIQPPAWRGALSCWQKLSGCLTTGYNKKRPYSHPYWKCQSLVPEVTHLGLLLLWIL